MHSTDRMPRCRGLLGLIFGHKFRTLNWSGFTPCLRCGMPRV